ncbi:uncharacterized protein RSE6_16101 [Rhynchosporium secalis]|uniref:Uncharacterized protein n=1 Tax=Rhynchosporium secalis TaxID=38038 RepID=A0A1E1ML26_RHYSE|nr:uncharacterized protein RSE6_16101 [Rhynchosporium secalis]
MKSTILSALLISSALSAAINDAAVNDAGLEARDPDYASCHCIGQIYAQRQFRICCSAQRSRSGNAQVFNRDGDEIVGNTCAVSWTRTKYCSGWSTGLTGPNGRNCDGKPFAHVDSRVVETRLGRA